MIVDKSLLREIPKVDEVLKLPGVQNLAGVYPRELVVESVRRILDEIRQDILEGTKAHQELNKWSYPDSLAARIAEKLERIIRPNLRRVINATGVVLHTNLGRAVLCPSAIEAVRMAASGYSNLELNLESGKRGSRYDSVEDLLKRLTGAQSSLVVNNNAAAVLLALSTLARGREVIVSRGQMVEIGGSFRIPEVMEQSGAILREVGSTNKTHPADYGKAINDKTALLLHVHTSNYRIVGFTREITVDELVDLGSEAGLPVMSDLGSGSIINMDYLGLPYEPTVQQTIQSGAGVVTFSGDKLLGGPQAGIIVGKKEFIDRMKKNPLTRAVRIDKMTVAALEATLREYLDIKAALQNIPTLRMISYDEKLLQKRCGVLHGLLKDAVDGMALIALEKGQSAVGGGAMPTADLPGWLVSVRPLNMPVEALADRLRNGDPAVMGRVQEDSLLLDVRTLLKDEDIILAGAVAAAMGREGSD
ncbi:MAG: selenocysteine synthase [Peptococcaceae bacterium BRH_c4a]|nr:MAG: selenocysteine synthase [Peptococcaceae bacterium BRH_c4a]